MRFSPALLAALAPLALAGCATAGGGPAPVVPPAIKLYSEMIRTLPSRKVKTLFVVLNGDGAPGTRSDERAFAASLQKAVPDSAAIVLLRHGHSDSAGHSSPGERGLGKGDSYDAPRLDDVWRTIAQLRRGYSAARLVIVGDDGGAVIAANLAGLHPQGVDGILLVGCPCALPEWRAHMAKRTGDTGWKTPVASLDPLKSAGGVSPMLRAAVLTGADDPVVPVKLARSYAEALVLRGVATDYRILPGKGHDLLGDAEVLAAAVRLAAALSEKP